MKISIDVSKDQIDEVISFSKTLSLSRNKRKRHLFYASGNDEGGEYIRAFDTSEDRSAWIRGGVRRKAVSSKQVSIQSREIATEAFDRMHQEFVRYLGLGNADSVDLATFVKTYKAFEKAYDFSGVYQKLFMVYKLIGGNIDREKAEHIVECAISKKRG